MLTFHFSDAPGYASGSDVLTTGMVGRQILVEFSGYWSELSKILVFSNGELTREVVFNGNPVTIPAEILAQPLKTLTVGAIGLGDGGSVVIPTIRVAGPVIQPSVVPARDVGTDTELPIWQQILARMGEPDMLLTTHKETLVGAINELAQRPSGGGGSRVYYIPSISEDGILSWSNNGGAPNPAPANVRGPAGADGYTPQRGTDYWTESDKAEIRRYVEDAILGGIW